jgi:hypothetical protein
MPPNSKKSEWGKGIFVLYGGFVVFILTLVVYASQQDFHLVESDYYEKELRYQRQIDGLDRTRQLSRDIEVGYEADVQILTISLPPESFASDTEGTIRLYRPSNAELDRVYSINPDAEGEQRFDVGELEKGLWRIHIGWSRDGAEYFSRQMMIVE